MKKRPAKKTESNGMRIANTVLMALVLVAAAIFLKNFIEGASPYFAQGNSRLFWEKYDWPDTAYMSQLVSRGLVFSADPNFIASAPLFGYFPPLFPLMASIAEAITGSYQAAFVLLSIAIWFATAYLVAKDWKGWEMKLAIIIIVFFLTAYIEWPPVLNRLRELFALFLMALLFKNPLKLERWKNFLLVGPLVILAQPAVALLGIAGYFFFDAETGRIKIERKMAFCLAGLAAFFIIAYYGHALALLENSRPQNYIGCSYVMPAYNAHDIMRLFFFYAIVSPFFLVFLPARELKYAYGLLVLASLLLLAAQNFPQLYMLITGPLASDMCYQSLPVLAFFALFPYRGGLDGKKALFLRAILISALLAQVVQSYTFQNSSGYGMLDRPEALFANNSTAIAARYYLWDAARQPYMIQFDFRLMSELALKGAPVEFVYSPVQQFYDPYGYSKDLAGIISGFAEKNMQECRLHASSLAKSGIDYASMEIVLDRSWQPEAERLDSWGYEAALSMANSTMISGCGMEPVLVEMGNRSQNYFIYRLIKQEK